MAVAVTSRRARATPTPLTTPASANLTLYQGDDYSAVVHVTAGGVAADLTGYTAKAQLRRDVADKADVVDAEFEAAIVGSDVLLALEGAVTEALSGKYVYDMQLTAADGAVQTVIAGTATVTAEVTR